MNQTMMTQNIIITERCRSLRQLGRNALRGKWKNGILATIIFMVCLTVPPLIFDNLFGMNMASFVTNDGYTYNIDPEFYQQMYNALPQKSVLSFIWMLLITGPMMLGLMLYFLASFRGHDVVPKDVFLGFERFGKAFGLFVYQYLFIVLWSLLFIIPGIIAAIRYSQAFFVLADDPSKTIRECMDESKLMMKGNKWKYFLLSLSFIGWMILASVPGSLLMSITGMMSTNSIAAMVVSLIASLFTTPVYTYVFSTFAGFYEILSGHLIKETEPVPLSADQIAVDAPVEKIEEVIEAVEAAEQDQLAAPAETAETAEGTASAIPEAIAAPDAVKAGEAPAVPAQKAAPREASPMDAILPESLNEEDKYND